MKLLKLLNGITAKEIINYNDIDITSITNMSTDVAQGSMYICLEGQVFNGHLFAQQAVENGAVCLLVKYPLDLNVIQVVVDDTRGAMAIVAKNFNDNVIDKMKLICVVGTNGKTSTAYLISQVLIGSGKSVGFIGTNGVYINETHLDTNLTTPDPIQLHSIFNLMYASGVEFVVMEVSAHAIYLNKMNGIKADITVFTNFSRDHLDFFKTMEEYKNVKMSFFNSSHTKIAVINADDETGQQIIKHIKIPCITYGVDNPSDCFAVDFVDSVDGIKYTMNILDDVCNVKYQLRGKFNMYNTLAASTVCRVFGIKASDIVQSISKVSKIDGRNMTIKLANGATAIVDFAHTPDGINNILSHLKQLTKGKLIVVFGCGGNRDKYKRPLMANAVSKYADYAILTNDNPRYEQPVDIITDIVCGMRINHEIVLDRYEAIKKAIVMSTEVDTVAIIGKGAEKYQEIQGKKYQFNDLEVVNKINESKD